MSGCACCSSCGCAPKPSKSNPKSEEKLKKSTTTKKTTSGTTTSCGFGGCTPCSSGSYKPCGTKASKIPILIRKDNKVCISNNVTFHISISDHSSLRKNYAEIPTPTVLSFISGDDGRIVSAGFDSNLLHRWRVF
jgi:hypothetical protein